MDWNSQQNKAVPIAKLTTNENSLTSVSEKNTLIILSSQLFQLFLSPMKHLYILIHLP